MSNTNKAKHMNLWCFCLNTTQLTNFPKTAHYNHHNPQEVAVMQQFSDLNPNPLLFIFKLLIKMFFWKDFDNLFVWNNRGHSLHFNVLFKKNLNKKIKPNEIKTH